MTERAFDGPSSRIAVSGVQNFRDAAISGIGGIRPGRLYRSGHLGQLTPAGARHLEPLGLRTVIDLRTTTELAVHPDQRHGLDFDLLHHPVLPDRRTSELPWPTDQTEMYVFMPEAGGQAIADTVRRLATPGSLPALLHCAVGKDRTGLTIAIIQSLTGAPEPDIIADFLQSNPNLGLDAGPIRYTDEYGDEHLSHPVTATHLTTALTHIHTLHGTLENYLRTYGVTDAELSALRAALIN
ncbi:tyrosine-protein phosphatase [Kitasatospora sp. MAP5-34]|uniref:tyrosine-protein phosphatase n=1 Tax=Kitasatospora sp. MAP5-34 TaxID=3035102 RepID=UPI002473CC95|nr:tyrosine-protein phosphatase [Kitasatospora sp. MAP5-34]MDH6577549.1 protein-tyrosine phosphatase [Kitasatospora sp. MAP5-34]